MRSEKRLTALIAVVLAFLLSFASVCCIVTGFDMWVNLSTVALWCGASALISGICFSLPAGFVPFGAATITGVALWFGKGMKLSFQAVIYFLSRKYNSTFGWGVLRPEHYTADMLKPETWLVLCFLGAVLAMLLTWSLCRRKTALPGMLLSAVCLGSCFLVQETVPDAIWLWLFLFGFLLLLLTQTARRADATRGNRLVAMAAVPLALFLTFLFVLIPQKNYTADKPAKVVTDAILHNSVFQAVFGDMTRTGIYNTGTEGSLVRLENVGAQELTYAEILQVSTDYSGVLYLRGRSLDTYDGKNWTHSGTSTHKLYWPSKESLESVGEVRLKTRFAHKMFYLPYYVQSMDLTDMTLGLDNKTKLTEYSFSTAILPDDNVLSSREEGAVDAVSQYLHLTKSVQKWAVPLAQEITAGKRTVFEKAQSIAAYVRDTAKYDLETDPMPHREKDFAKWFLEDSETGYCTHFATAAAVLLQAAEIPARYVTGYKVAVSAGNTATVCSADAHAWVEYWLPGFGWTVLEATPAAQEEQPETTYPVSHPHKTKIDGPVAAVIGGIVLLLTIVAVFVQRAVRLSLRQKKLRIGTVKQRILAYWQESVRFANCLQEHPGGELLAVAEKAKFSNHALREEEFAAFETYLQGAKGRIRKHGFFRKLYYRFVLALY